MTKQLEALKLALEALEYHPGNYKLSKAEWAEYIAVEDAIREALAEQPAQQQEPVAVYVGETWCGSVVRLYDDLPLETLLYTSPQANANAGKPWVGLTEQERNDLEDYCEMIIGKAAFDAIESRLKEKNSA